MAANTGIGLTAQQYYYFGSGLDNLVEDQGLSWTLNYSRMGYVAIPEWRPAGRFRVEFTMRVVDPAHLAQHLFDNTAEPGNRTVIFLQSAQRNIFYQGSSSPTRITVTSFEYENSMVVSLDADATGVSGFTGFNLIGIRSNLIEAFDGQLHTIRLTDLENPSNSRFYPSIIRSDTMPSELVLVDELGDGATNGTLTNFPAAQPWVPVLGTGQGYAGDFTEGAWISGVNTSVRRITSSLTNNSQPVKGSFALGTPPVGSVVRSGSVVLQVTVSAAGTDSFTYAPANGTPAQIQAAFQHPNVFQIDPFDSATEAYCGDLTRNDGFILGVNTGDLRITSVGLNIQGSFLNNVAPLLGNHLTAGNGSVILITAGGGSSVNYTVVRGTNEEIQQGFQWPNHFTVTPPP